MTGTPSGAGAAPAGPLAGVRVVDATSVLLGPYCTQILGDLGADVIKVEAPDGDATRGSGQARSPGMATGFLNVNRNKRSVAVDLKHPDGRQVVLDLLRGADVFVTNVRRRAVERLGLGWDAVRATNPRLVYCNAVGYGEGGPYADHPAFDDTIQAIAGLAGVQSEYAGEPQFMATAIADKVSGLTLAIALLAALRHRDATGEGQQVEVPMFETMAAFGLVEHLQGRTFEPPMGPAVNPRLVSKSRRPVRTADGVIAVLPFNDGQWRRCFAAIGRPELADDPRFATIAERSVHFEALNAIVADALARRTTADWLEVLGAHQVPAMPVQHGDALLDDPQLRATGLFRRVEHPTEGTLNTIASPMRFSSTPATLRRHAPALGEHTAEVLAELGYARERVAAMFDARAVAGVRPAD